MSSSIVIVSSMGGIGGHGGSLSGHMGDIGDYDGVEWGSYWVTGIVAIFMNSPYLLLDFL